MELDTDLVQEAYNELSRIVVKKWSEAMEEVGGYLIEKFYDNNPQAVRDKKPTKEESLHQLIQKIHQKKDDAPSKSWIYNAINLAADKKQFELESYDKYNQLGLSQKVCIASVQDMGKKKELIEETLDQNYSVEQLKERISQDKKKRNTIDLKALPDKRKLKKYKASQIENLKKRTAQKISNLEEKQKAIREELSAFKDSQKKLEEVLAETTDQG